jgi:hypothetical protein
MKITKTKLRQIIKEAIGDANDAEFEAEFNDWNGPSKFNFEYLGNEIQHDQLIWRFKVNNIDVKLGPTTEHSAADIAASLADDISMTHGNYSTLNGPLTYEYKEEGHNKIIFDKFVEQIKAGLEKSNKFKTDSKRAFGDISQYGQDNSMWESKMNIKQKGEYSTIHRDDGKIVVSSDMVYDHIGKHGRPGAGSIFSGGITPDMINKFLVSANIPDGGGGIPADFPGGGYLLVAPFESAMKLQDATVKEGAKEDFDPKQKKMVPVPVAQVHTSQPIKDFATDETTVLVFPYDPNRSSPEQNKFVDGDPELASALANKNLYALATAFPGGFKVEGQNVPKSTEWGGVKNPTWAVIIPDSKLQNNDEQETSNQEADDMINEHWLKIAGLL